MNRTKKKHGRYSRYWIPAAAGLMLAMAATVRGEFLIDGSFSSGITGANTGNNETSLEELDAGWDHKGGWDLSGGNASNTTTHSTGGLAQVVSVGAASGHLSASPDRPAPSVSAPIPGIATLTTSS